MARFVMKFGGTSVANIALLERIADRVQRVQKADYHACNDPVNRREVWRTTRKDEINQDR